MATIFISLARSKVLALVLGPAGVGVVAILQSVMGTASTVIGLGLGSSGVRQIAASDGDPAKLATVRRALWRSNVVLGLVGMAAVWALRVPIAEATFGDAARAGDVAWMGLGVLLSLILGSQTALIRGMRRVGDMVKAGLIGSAVGSAAGIAVVWLMGEDGVTWFVLTAPAAGVLSSAYYARKLPRPAADAAPAQTFWEQWREMVSLGAYMMVAAAATSLTALVVRSILARELGVDAAGQFQAAYAISGQYMGLVLGARWRPTTTPAWRRPSARGAAARRPGAS